MRSTNKPINQKVTKVNPRGIKSKSSTYDSEVTKEVGITRKSGMPATMIKSSRALTGSKKSSTSKVAATKKTTTAIKPMAKKTTATSPIAKTSVTKKATPVKSSVTKSPTIKKDTPAKTTATKNKATVKNVRNAKSLSKATASGRENIKIEEHKNKINHGNRK